MNIIKSNQVPVYSGQFPPYQVDFTKTSSGKRVSATKRRVRWRFGFANPEAILAGKSSIDCRGDEHEIILVWSITSGKRSILFDGEEIHYSVRARGGDAKFEHSWDWRTNHTLKIVAYATSSYNRQFDLTLDGRSFFEFPRIYELGGLTSHVSTTTIDNSIEDDTHEANVPYEASNTTTSDILSKPLPVDIFAVSDTKSNEDAFNPIEVAPSYESISSEILKSYDMNTSPTIDSLPNQVSFDDSTVEIDYSPCSTNQTNSEDNISTHVSTKDMSYQRSNDTTNISSGTTFTFETYADKFTNDTNLEHMDKENTAHIDDKTSNVDIAMKKLVNIEDITSMVVDDDEPLRLTMSPNGIKSATAKDKNRRSRGIPPKATSWYSNQTLGEMKTLKTTSTPKQSVMKASSFTETVSDGALVPYVGAGQSSGYSAPPIAHHVGFGVGSQVHYQTMNQYQVYNQY